MSSPSRERALRERRIPLAKPCFDAEEEALIRAVLRSGWVTQGPRVTEFERDFAVKVGVAEAVAVSSCTAALFLSLQALGVGPGDEVIVPSLSFIASTNVIVHCGATPVLVDIDPRTYNLDPEAVAGAVTTRTRAILVVHQSGLPADLERLSEIARRHGLLLLEDAACAQGSRYLGEWIGGSGNLTCFSFHPRKLIVTGEGGMITLHDTELASKLRRLRHQGMSVSDADRAEAGRVVVEDYPEIGYNFRMSDLHAALGIVQLRKLESFLTRRRRLGARYDTALGEMEGIATPFTPEYATWNYQSYTVRLRGVERHVRDQVMDALQRRGIVTRRALIAAHQEPCYQSGEQVRIFGSLEHTEAAAAQTFVIPMYPELSEEDQEYVIGQLREVLAEVGLPAAGLADATDR